MITLRALAPSWQIIFVILSACVQVKNEDKAVTVLPADHPHPSWISDTPIVFIGNWDAMPIFRRRIGGNPVWQEKAYYSEHTDSAVRKYKEMGVTMMMLHFYKGFGLEAEKEQIEETKKLAEICRNNGLKVGVYVGSTIGYETFLLEKPEAVAWFVPDYMGQPVLYGDQTFRKRVYFMHPGYIEYMKNVLRVAILDLKADLIHFDNTSMQAEPVIFHHPMAIADFRKYLTQKYSPEKLKERFGFSDPKYVEPPRVNGMPSKIDDPLFQEWTNFRCHQLSEYYRIMDEYIHGLNPEVAIDNNPHSGLSGINTSWKQGIDYPELLTHTDFIWTEEGNDPTVTEDGILISRIRTFKMARILDNRIFTYTTDSKLEMAEALAYNRQVMGMVGGLKEMEGNQVAGGYELPEDQKAYIKFFHDNFGYYKDVNSIADVAVLHSFSSMAFNNDRPYQSTYLYEQVLIQNRIPFDIVFDSNLKNLKKYKVLILADQESLGNEQLDMIRAFVNDGGGVVATEFTSLYNERHERLSDFGLADLLKISPPAWKGRNAEESILEIPVRRLESGRGRIVYVPEIKPALVKPAGADMSAKYWKLPLNASDLIGAVQWASGNEMTITVSAPETITTEITKSMDNLKMMIHLVNYRKTGRNREEKIDISMTVPEGSKIRSVELLSPDFTDKLPLDFRIKDGKVQFRVSKLDIYDLVVLNLN
jgi:hypothetical protein